MSKCLVNIWHRKVDVYRNEIRESKFLGKGGDSALNGSIDDLVPEFL